VVTREGGDAKPPPDARPAATPARTGTGTTRGTYQPTP
jgi:hypothetical protein